METDLLALVEQDGFRPTRRPSTSRGGQYNGPCPWCGGDDRFRVRPNYGTYGWFACTQCGRKGNAVDYLMLKRNYTKREALAAVGWKPKEERTEPNLPHVPTTAYHEKPQWNAPPQQWQEGARDFARDTPIPYLSRRDALSVPFSRMITGLSQVASQHHLIHRDGYHQALVLTLLGTAHMHLDPQQILLEEAIVVFMGDASPWSGASRGGGGGARRSGMDSRLCAEASDGYCRKSTVSATWLLVLTWRRRVVYRCKREEQMQYLQ